MLLFHVKEENHFSTGIKCAKSSNVISLYEIFCYFNKHNNKQIKYHDKQFFTLNV